MFLNNTSIVCLMGQYPLIYKISFDINFKVPV